MLLQLIHTADKDIAFNVLYQTFLRIGLYPETNLNLIAYSII